jgi:hypothetical protein
MRFYAGIWQQYTEVNTYFLGGFDVTESLSYETQLHGGYFTCSFVIPARAGSTIYRVILGGHVVIFDQYGNRVWEGSIIDTSIEESGVSVSASGYYEKASHVFSDMIYVTSPTTVSDILIDAVDMVPEIQDVFAFIGSSDYNVMSTDPDTADIIPQDFTDKKVSEVIESVMKYAYKESDIRPIYFAVWNHRIPFLIPEPLPTFYPDWQVSVKSISGGREGVTISLSEVYNKVFAVYDNQGEGPSKTVPVENTFSQARYGVREGLVQNGGSVEGLAIANDLAAMALSTYQYPKQIYTMEIEGYVRHGSGFYSEPHRIKAGQQILVLDSDSMLVNTGTLAGQAAHGFSGFILSTSYNSESHSMSVSFGSSDTRFDTYMTRLGLSGGLQ